MICHHICEAIVCKDQLIPDTVAGGWKYGVSDR